MTTIIVVGLWVVFATVTRVTVNVNNESEEEVSLEGVLWATVAISLGVAALIQTLPIVA